MPSSLKTDCQLLDALESRRPAAGPSDLTHRLEQLCENHGLTVTSEEVNQASKVVQQRMAGSDQESMPVDWKRPTAAEWPQIQADLAGVERLWKRTYTGMKWGVAAVGATVFGLIASKVSWGQTSWFGLILMTFFAFVLVLAGGATQGVLLGGVSVIREGWRLRQWRRRFGLKWGYAKYVLVPADPDPEALTRWKETPQTCEALRTLLRTPVPLLTLDVQRLNELSELERYQASKATRARQWEEGLQGLQTP